MTALLALLMLVAAPQPPKWPQPVPAVVEVDR